MTLGRAFKYSEFMLDELKNKIDKLLREWQQLQPLQPEAQEKLDAKVRLQWNYQSNHIEGNTLTYHQTELLLMHDRCEGGHAKRNYDEMKAHDVAINQVQQWAQNKTRSITEADIRTLNKIILKEPFFKKAQTSTGQPTQKKIIPGQYKAENNHVHTVSGNVFKFADYMDVPERMYKLVHWLQSELQKPSLHLVEVISQLHYEFICIHPFDDGNGRVARLLVNYVLLRQGCMPLVIASEDKNNYFRALEKADAGDQQAFTLYIGEQLERWLRTGIQAAKGQSIEDASDIDKQLDLFVRGKTQRHQISRKLLLQFYDTSFIKICEALEYKLKKLSPLFAEQNVVLKFGRDCFCIEQLNTIFVNKIRTFVAEHGGIYDNNLQQYVEKQLREQSYFLAFGMQFQNYKHTANNLHLRLCVYVVFEEYRYIVKAALLPSSKIEKRVGAQDSAALPLAKEYSGHYPDDSAVAQGDASASLMGNDEGDESCELNNEDVYDNLQNYEAFFETTKAYGQDWPKSEVQALVKSCQKEVLSYLDDRTDD